MRLILTLLWGLIIDVLRNVFSIAWRVGVGWLFQMWLYDGLIHYGTSELITCFFAVCVAAGIVVWTKWTSFEFGFFGDLDYSCGMLIRWILLSLVTIVYIAVIPIMVTVF